MDKYLASSVGMTFETKTFVALTDIDLADAQGRVRHADRPLRLRQDARCSTWWPGCSSPPTARCCSPARESTARGPDRGVVFQNHSLLPWLTCFGNVYLAVERVFARKTKLKNAHPPRSSWSASPTPSTSTRTRSRAA